MDRETGTDRDRETETETETEREYMCLIKYEVSVAEKIRCRHSHLVAMPLLD